MYVAKEEEVDETSEVGPSTSSLIPMRLFPYQSVLSLLAFIPLFVCIRYLVRRPLPFPVRLATVIIISLSQVLSVATYLRQTDHHPYLLFIQQQTTLLILFLFNILIAYVACVCHFSSLDRFICSHRRLTTAILISCMLCVSSSGHCLDKLYWYMYGADAIGIVKPLNVIRFLLALSFFFWFSPGLMMIRTAYQPAIEERSKRLKIEEYNDFLIKLVLSNCCAIIIYAVLGLFFLLIKMLIFPQEELFVDTVMYCCMAIGTPTVISISFGSSFSAEEDDESYQEILQPVVTFIEA